MKRLLVGLLVVGCGVLSTFAFPSWMGVYGENQLHDGGNPGVFTVLMNQDYWGLHCEAWICVDSGEWMVRQMDYGGNVDGNSKWMLQMGEVFPSGATVEFYFRAWDDGGNSAWVKDGELHYSFVAGPARLFWIGNVVQSPTNGALTPESDLMVGIESWPRKAATKGGVLYTSTKGLIWSEAPLTLAGIAGANDFWMANLGWFGWNKEIQYAIFLTDEGGAMWENNHGRDFRAKVNMNPALEPDGDADGDGIPNGVEYEWGYDPTDPRDGLRDSDADGMADGLEYQLGTQRLLADSDGDGVPDFEEFYGLLSDPVISNAYTFTRVHTVDLASFVEQTGGWAVRAGYLRPTSPRGRLKYNVPLPDGDIYRIVIRCSGVGGAATLRLKMDGIPLLRDERFGARHTQNGIRLSFITPFVTAGMHEFELEWDNTYSWNELAIQRIRFEAIADSDEDGNGIKDWVDDVLEARNSASLMPSASVLSPAFVEGMAHYVDAMKINDGAIPVRQGVRGWYADVPLSGDHAVPVEISFENGGLVERHAIEWVPLNLLLAADMTVRKGDTLKFMAGDDASSDAKGGRIRVSINGALMYELMPGEAATHTFDAAGEMLFVTEWVQNTTIHASTQTFTVVEASFPSEPPICSLDRARAWECPGIGPGATIVSDPALFLEHAVALPSGGYKFMLTTDRYRARYIEARAGSETGPILDSTPIWGVEGFGSNHTWLHDIDTLPDGSTLYEIGIIMAPLRDTISLKVSSLGGGITFDDGTLEKTFTSEEFDETGVRTVRMLTPPGSRTGPSHNVALYQNGILIAK